MFIGILWEEQRGKTLGCQKGQKAVAQLLTSATVFVYNKVNGSCGSKLDIPH